jgi:diguanylate cyclase (GGDEF)-like protein/putative nucleotidyltransferase with HDIG domain
LALLHRWELWLYVALAVLAGGKTVRLLGKLHGNDSCSMSVGYGIAFAAILRFGPFAGAFVSAVSCLSSCLYPKRQPLHQLAFNVSVGILDGWLAGVAMNTIDGGVLTVSPVLTFCAAAAASVTYFLVNTVPVATIISLVTGQRIDKVWSQNFVWTAPSYFAGACACTLAMVILKEQAGMVILFISPVLFFSYRSYSIYVERAEEKQRHIEELANLYLSTIKSLALAIDAKDQYTHQHILRVQRYAVAIAKHMGVTGDLLESINTGALLHDIGKLGVPEYVLLKPGRLTDEEFEKIKKHPEIGADILGPVKFPWPVLPVVKHHHEKWDGSGYPDGLAGESIPLTARILAVADVYDALTSNRSYRSAWSHERAVAEIVASAGKHFDPNVVAAFESVIDGVIEEMRAEHECAIESAQASPATESDIATEAKAERAVRNIQRTTSELWALYELAQTLSSILGLDDTLKILGSKLELIMPGTMCVFLLRDENSGSDRLVARYTVGACSEFLRNAHTIDAKSTSWRALDTNQSYCGSYDADDLMFDGELAAGARISSMLVAPLMHQGVAIGTINLYHSETDAFGAHDLELLEAIAERAALALHNAMIYDRTSSHAQTDSLTGLFNVRYMTNEIDRRCRAGLPFTVLCLDLDSFKPVNDNFGHLKGDQVLKDLSGIFRSMVRERDIVARYGGDEFLILIEDSDPNSGAELAVRLESAVTSYETMLVHDQLGPIRLGVSIGVASFPRDGYDCASLISAADSEMYRNKSDRKLRHLTTKKTRTESIVVDDFRDAA